AATATAASPKATGASPKATPEASGKALLGQRELLNKQEQVIAALRVDLAGRSKAVAKADEKRRGAEAELIELRKKLREVEKQVVAAQDLVASASADKELAVRRGNDALR